MARSGLQPRERGLRRFRRAVPRSAPTEAGLQAQPALPYARRVGLTPDSVCRAAERSDRGSGSAEVAGPVPGLLPRCERATAEQFLRSWSWESLAAWNDTAVPV